MKCLSSLRCGIVLGSLVLSAASAFSQGTAFTYQGQLDSGGTPATGLYDFTNALYNASSGPAQVGPTITLNAVPVTNGLFTVILDFGSVFNGTAYWLQMGVRSNGVGNYVPLSPRQELTPTPYAITAENLDGTLLASQLTGTLPSGVLSGTYGNALNFNNPADSFTGNGAGLTSLNASQLTSGTVADARLSANVALLNADQTFTGANIFDRGLGGPGRLIVAGSASPDLSLFTGLGFQYYDSTGEGAIMSSFNDGYGYLSFYTKAASGRPIQKEMIIDKYGVVGIDQGNYNNGFLNNGDTNGAGLIFGVSSGEGIASKRTAGGNQNGLDFYTAFTLRMSLANSGNLVFPDPMTSIQFPATSGANNPMMYMFASGIGNADRMVIAHSPGFPSYGLQYQDVGDKFNFLSAGTPVLTVDLGNDNVGIGTSTAGAKLDVRGDIKLGPAGGLFASSGNENLRIIRGIVQPTGVIFNGTGFTITHNSAGNYSITFSPAFADAPALIITGYSDSAPVVVNCTGGTGSGYSSIDIWKGGVKTDEWFNLVAIGTR